jgi:hypothetical protein
MYISPTNLYSSSQEGGRLDFDTKDDLEKPSTDF